MTFRDLQKVIQSQSNPEHSQTLQRLTNKEFWYWDHDDHKNKDKKTNGDCCFNHIVKNIWGVNESRMNINTF